jgi:hypothetical protein
MSIVRQPTTSLRLKLGSWRKTSQKRPIRQQAKNRPITDNHGWFLVRKFNSWNLQKLYKEKDAF